MDELNEISDSLNGSIFILGQIGDEAAIVHLQRTVLPTDKASQIIAGLDDLKVHLENQPVSPPLLHLVRSSG